MAGWPVACHGRLPRRYRSRRMSNLLSENVHAVTGVARYFKQTQSEALSTLPFEGRFDAKGLPA